METTQFYLKRLILNNKMEEGTSLWWKVTLLAVQEFQSLDSSDFYFHSLSELQNIGFSSKFQTSKSTFPNNLV